MPIGWNSFNLYQLYNLCYTSVSKKHCILNSAAGKCISACFRYDKCKWMHFWDTPEVLSYAHMPKRPYGDTPQHHLVEYGRASNGLQCATPHSKSDAFARHPVGQTNCVLSSKNVPTPQTLNRVITSPPVPSFMQTASNLGTIGTRCSWGPVKILQPGMWNM